MEKVEEIAREIVEKIVSSLRGHAALGWDNLDADIREEMEAELVALVRPVVEEAIGIANPCPECGGRGLKVYGDTSTWRKRGGGQTITTDVCDVCWGSRTSDRTGANLRKMDGCISALEFRAQAAEKERDELQHEYDDAENSAIAVIGELRAEVERLRSCERGPKACDVEIAALQQRVDAAETGRRQSRRESERLSQRVRELEAGLSDLVQSIGIPAPEEWLDARSYERAMAAYKHVLTLLQQQPAPQPEEPKHACGLTGYNPMKGDSCPACVAPGLDGRELYWLKAKISEPVYVSCADENCIGCDGVHLKPSEPR